MHLRSALFRFLAIAALLAALFAAGFVSRLVARVEAPRSSAIVPLQLAPLVALPFLHGLLLTQ